RYMYEVRDPGTDVPRMLRNRQVISVGNLGMDGMTGHRLIDFLAHNNVGLARSISRYVESFFGNNTAVNVYLSTDDKIRDAETKKKHLQSFRRAFGSSKNAFKPMLLDGGLQVKKLGVDNQAAQTLELLSYSVKDIARWFNVPPHMLAELGDATFSNITEQVLSYVKFSLTPWLIAYEQELSRKLLSPSESRTHFIEFVLEGLLRGAPKERGEFYKTMFSIGAYSINDIRRRENENSIGPAGDAHFVPVNMITAERLVEGGTKQPPQQERPPEPAQPNGNIERASIGVFVDAATRVITREVKAARSASGRYAGDRFESWIGRFFAREPGKIIDAFSPVVLALCEYHGARYDDVGSHLADLADEYAKRAASELSSASNVDALLDVWTVERIPSFATEVLERMAKVIDHEE
ncbi:MAG: phage portal protein, partial [Woeseiaceae bacterium]